MSFNALASYAACNLAANRQHAVLPRMATNCKIFLIRKFCFAFHQWLPLAALLPRPLKALPALLMCTNYFPKQFGFSELHKHFPVAAFSSSTARDFSAPKSMGLVGYKF